MRPRPATRILLLLLAAPALDEGPPGRREVVGLGFSGRIEGLFDTGYALDCDLEADELVLRPLPGGRERRLRR